MENVSNPGHNHVTMKTNPKQYTHQKQASRISERMMCVKSEPKY